MESIHNKLKRVRKPRVHISYEVETEGAVAKKELPFVVGVMGDFSGDPTSPLKSLKDRRFVQIDRDNFNSVLASMNAGINMKVKNILQDDGSEFAVNLKFETMDELGDIVVSQQAGVPVRVRDVASVDAINIKILQVSEKSVTERRV